MSRFKTNELSIGRLFDALERRVSDIPHAIAWRKRNGFAEINRERLVRFKGKHTGERCFIIGNGPSLGDMDLRPLKNEFTFGLNRIYLLFDKIHFIPTYYVSVNELVLDQFANDIRSLAMPKFLNWDRRSLFDHDDLSTFFMKIKFGLSDSFAVDIRNPLCGGGTVTFVALQLAYYMGFETVILIGVDHNFVDQGPPNRIALRTQVRDNNHFHPEYFPGGTKWQFPDLTHSEAAYALAKSIYENNGKHILDATVNGKCPVFDRIDYSTLF
jgi:hypothetical protein